MAGSSQRARLAAAVAVGVVLLSGVGAAMVVDDDGQEREVGVRALGQPDGSTSSTTTSSSSTTTTSTAPPPSSSTTVTTAPPPPSTTAAASPVTTTTPPLPARSFGVQPSAGPAGTPARAFASGCVAPDGSETGVSLAFFDPSGQEVPGDGAAARADGSWELAFAFPAGPPGEWSIEAVCRAGHHPTVYFTYPERATYRLT